MKKLSALILAVLLALTLSATCFAEEEPHEVWLVVGAQLDGWHDTMSEERMVFTESGEYTIKLEGLSYPAEKLALIYIKDAIVEKGLESESNFRCGFDITTKSIKVNGVEMELTEGYGTTFDGTGTFEINWFSIWGTKHFSVEQFTEINSVEVVIDIRYHDDPVEEPAPEVTEEPSPEEPAEEAPATDPEVTEEETPAETGLALSLIPAAIALTVVVLKRS